MKKSSFNIKIVLFFIILSGLAHNVKSQSYAVKTNLVGLATTNLNAEVSAALDLRWSVHLPVQYNPWSFGDNKKIKNLTTMPGVRYWLSETYGYGYFVGANAIVSRFNAGGMFGHDYRYDGNAFGAGFSFGFSKPVARRWNLEAELGVGAVHSSYRKYDCMTCGSLLKEEKGIYFVPSKVAINLVYLF